MILHYLGIIGIVLGAIALVFGNTSRAKELAIGGVSFIAVKYIIGAIYVGVSALLNKGK